MARALSLLAFAYCRPRVGAHGHTHPGRSLGERPGKRGHVSGGQEPRLFGGSGPAKPHDAAIVVSGGRFPRLSGGWQLVLVPDLERSYQMWFFWCAA